MGHVRLGALAGVGDEVGADGTLTPFASGLQSQWQALTTKAGCGPSTTRATGLAPARSTTWRQGALRPPGFVGVAERLCGQAA